MSSRPRREPMRSLGMLDVFSGIGPADHAVGARHPPSDRAIGARVIESMPTTRLRVARPRSARLGVIAQTVAADRDARALRLRDPRGDRRAGSHARAAVAAEVRLIPAATLASTAADGDRLRDLARAGRCRAR